jgi:diguanylate cyclase (GGDEF)-like protein
VASAHLRTPKAGFIAPSAARTTPIVSERPRLESIPTLSTGLASEARSPSPGLRPLLTLLSGDRVGMLVPLGEADIVLGRGLHVDVYLNDPGLSRRHARFFRDGDQVCVEDLGSTNGTFVGAERIVGPIRLRDGDRIQLGSGTLLRYALQDAFEEEVAMQLYESSIRDAASGAFNRRHFEQRFVAEAQFAERRDSPLSLLLVDIDQFKLVNDDFGHLVGDSVLRVVAANMQRMLRPDDVLARYGGDEFVVLCRDTTLKNARILAERIRVSNERLALMAQGNEFHITSSIGVACAGERDEFNALVATADRALYAAKAKGRNCVVSACQE